MAAVAANGGRDPSGWIPARQNPAAAAEKPPPADYCACRVHGNVGNVGRVDLEQLFFASGDWAAHRKIWRHDGPVRPGGVDWATVGREARGSPGRSAPSSRARHLAGIWRFAVGIRPEPKSVLAVFAFALPGRCRIYLWTGTEYADQRTGRAWPGRNCHWLLQCGMAAGIARFTLSGRTGFGLDW